MAASASATSAADADSKKPLPWQMADVLEATGAKLVCGQTRHQFGGVTIDSRTIEADQIFVAIKGENHDGHRFISDVVQKGVKGLIIQQGHAADLDVSGLKKNGVACVAVADTVKALGDLAAFSRNRTGVKVVAITGSNGKTSTRRMTAAVLSQKYEVLTPEGNFNNEIGLPLTLLRLTEKHQWAVLELGMNHFGEIDRLGAICTPELGIITNVGPVHLEGIGSLDGVMQAKGELLSRIKADGTAVLNADDKRVVRLAEKSPVATCMFGEGPDADVSASQVQEIKTGICFKLCLPAGEVPVALNTPGRFMVQNGLAAAAVGHLIGLTPQEIKTGLESFCSTAGRLGITKTASGVSVVDDTYNANPVSMEAAIATLVKLSDKGRSHLVVGDMLELGPEAKNWHRKIGTTVAEAGIKRLYATGQHASDVACGAVDAGMSPDMVTTGAKKELVTILLNEIRPDDWVLVKGSRAMKMETIVAKLTTGEET